jgi:hypothetical protein
MVQAHGGQATGIASYFSGKLAASTENDDAFAQAGTHCFEQMT